VRLGGAAGVEWLKRRWRGCYGGGGARGRLDWRLDGDVEGLATWTVHIVDFVKKRKKTRLTLYIVPTKTKSLVGGTSII
jgi:hypothetical protein